MDGYKEMKILDRLIGFFNRQRNLLLGSVNQPDDLIAFIHAVHARAYLKITGKSLPRRSMLKMDTTNDMDDITSGLSPSRRLARRRL